MKVAIIHDHLAQDGGAERVVQVWRQMWPTAPIYTLVYRPDHAHSSFRQADIRTSFIQRLPGGSRFYQWYLPYMAAAVERYDLREFDLVLSSSASFAKGVITLPTTLHLSYIYSPTRYLWSDTIQYVNDLPYPRLFRSLAPLFLTSIRQWDRLAADRPDLLVAISQAVRQRIQKYYRRSSEVIYPPVETQKFTVSTKTDNYYITGGRLVPYKRFDLTIRAFNKLGIPLKIYGSGPAEKDLRALAKPNIEFLGRVSDADLNDLYGRAIAFVNPQEEDFGITVVEAMATGRPVIAYAAGGALETVKPGLSGAWFADQDWESLADTIIHFKPETYNPSAIRAWADKFSVEQYRQIFGGYVEQAWQNHKKSLT
jgi:glycosyltransferase involved in cell wall biosynthesis